MITTQSIPEQLVLIYAQEHWHKTRMPYETALDYHKSRYENGVIHTYEENGEVLGYYERYIQGDTCILYNTWIKEDCRRGKVFKALRRHFFETLPKNITHITGEKVKLGGKIMQANLIRGNYGKH